MITTVEVAGIVTVRVVGAGGQVQAVVEAVKQEHALLILEGTHSEGMYVGRAVVAVLTILV